MGNTNLEENIIIYNVSKFDSNTFNKTSNYLNF